MVRAEPPYPEDVAPPPSRYKTGYGNEPYVITPPWSKITAYDLNTGKIKWQTPYGDLPQAGPSDKLRGNVYPKSGSVITAGGLVLFAGNDSKLYALDKDTGKLICYERPAEWLPGRAGRLRGEWQAVCAAGCLRRQSVPGRRPARPGRRESAGDFEELYRVCPSGGAVGGAIGRVIQTRP